MSSAAVSRLVLVSDPRGPMPGAPVRRYRLARLRLNDVADAGGRERFGYLKRSYD